MALIGIFFEDIFYLNPGSSTKDIELILSQKPIIFLMGGDTVVQNHFTNRLNLKKYLKNYSQLIIGMSAGALNTCSQVGIHEKNKTFILEGLGLHEYDIDVHYNGSKYENISNNNKIVYAINDDGAMIIHHKEVIFLGEVHLINKIKSLI